MKTDVVVYASGLVACSVCAPVVMEPEEVSAQVNRIHPTGISSNWAISKDERFAGGEEHPKTCEQDASRRHWLLEC